MAKNFNGAIRLIYHAHLQPPVTDPPANPAEAVQAVSARKLDYNALTYVLADVIFNGAGTLRPRMVAREN